MHLRAGLSVHYKGSPDENCLFWEMYPECPCVSVWASFFPVRVIRVLCVVRVFSVCVLLLSPVVWVLRKMAFPDRVLSAPC